MNLLSENITVDINCDIEPGQGEVEKLFPFITSCNIACGGHAGGRESIGKVIELAKEYGVRIGAHPSYPDRANFGRVVMDIPMGELRRSIRQQVTLLFDIAAQYEVEVHHVKAHGALYNAMYAGEEIAAVYLAGLESFRGNVILYVAPHSVVAGMAQKLGFEIKLEAFIDRRYEEDLSLVPRGTEGAVITTPEEALGQLLLMLEKSMVQTISGKEVPVRADTYCLHGDNPNAYEIARYINQSIYG